MSSEILVKPSIGMMDEVRSILLGTYGGPTGGQYGLTLHDKLDAIVGQVEYLNNYYLQQIKATNAYPDIAQWDTLCFEINKWYGSDVSAWLKSKSVTPAPTGVPNSTASRILQNCMIDLNLMHSHIVDPVPDPVGGGNETLLSSQLKALLNCESAKHITESFVETMYKSFLCHVLVQLRGVMCLRYIGDEQYANHSYQILNNINAQMRYYQELISPYHEESHADYQNFNWFLQGAISPAVGRQTGLDGCHISSVSQTCVAGSVSAGIEFNISVEGNQAGLQIASNQVDKTGNFLNDGDSQWLRIQNSPPASTIGLSGLYNPTPIILNPGEVITGISLQSNPTSEALVDVSYCSMDAEGNLNGGFSISQEPKSVTGSCSNLSLGQLGGNPAFQMSTSPITGFCFNQFANQLAVQLQTSLHAKACWAPVSMGHQTNLVSISNGITNMSLCVSNGATKTDDTTAKQAFVLEKSSSGPIMYGSIIQIRGSGLLDSNKYLQTNPSDYSVSFTSNTSDNGNANNWIVVNPTDLTAPVNQVDIDNWFPIALKSAVNEDYFLRIKNVDGVPTICAKVAPTEVTSSGITIISDSSYLFNFSPTKNRVVGNFNLNHHSEVGLPESSLSLGGVGTTPLHTPEDGYSNNIKLILIGVNNYILQSTIDPAACLQFTVTVNPGEDSVTAAMAYYNPAKEGFGFSITPNSSGQYLIDGLTGDDHYGVRLSVSAYAINFVYLAAYLGVSKEQLLFEISEVPS